MSMEFTIFTETKEAEDPLALMIKSVQKSLGKPSITLKVHNTTTATGQKAAEKQKVDEIPAIFFEKVRISGQLNEYFILACVANLLSTDGDDQKGSDILLEGELGDIKLKTASEFLSYQTQIREETKTFLMLIRESVDEIDTEVMEELANNGTTIFILTNFKEGENGKEVAKLGNNENILLGHILRTNIHKTLAITVRKGRPFFGAYLRAKHVEDKWKGKWSPLLHDSVTELKNFYVPLFLTSAPVHLDGTIPEDPQETNRLVAKVKDGIEVVKNLFF